MVASMNTHTYRTSLICTSKLGTPTGFKLPKYEKSSCPVLNLYRSSAACVYILCRPHPILVNMTELASSPAMAKSLTPFPATDLVRVAGDHIRDDHRSLVRESLNGAHRLLGVLPVLNVVFLDHTHWRCGHHLVPLGLNGLFFHKNLEVVDATRS